MNYGYHREVIHNIFKDLFIDVSITTSALGDMFDYFRWVSSTQSKYSASTLQDTEKEIESKYEDEIEDEQITN